MADEGLERASATADSARNPSHHKTEQAKDLIEGVDFISSLPDEILHHALSFIPINLAIRTSLLSRRWRHVWCKMPCLNFDSFYATGRRINQTLNSYTAKKIMSCHFRITLDHTAPQVDSWIEFAMSRNVEKLSVVFVTIGHETYSFPESFYLSSFLKQLSVELRFFHMIPICNVSWKHLRNLSLRCCILPDDSMANILSGCPILESLTLYFCDLLERLDLRKSPSLRRLEIDRNYWVPGPTEIVAPHIHYLRLRNSDLPCSLVDVSSLTEANLNLCIHIRVPLKADSLQIMVLKMLTKLQNVERLTIKASFLQILSLAELRGVAFPTLKAKVLVIETMITRSIIPGIVRLLQNSPGLKKLNTIYTGNTEDIDLDEYFNSQGLNPDKYWRSKYEIFPTPNEVYSIFDCKDATSKLLASFIEFVLRNTKTLETMVVRLGRFYFDVEWFEEQLQMVQTLSHENNVSIVLKRSNC